jgi:hypothetical protein
MTPKILVYAESAGATRAGDYRRDSIPDPIAAATTEERERISWMILSEDVFKEDGP